MPVLLHPRYWGAHLLMVVALAAAVALGVWQLHVWQVGRDVAAQDLSDAEPIALSTAMGGDDPFPSQYLGQPVRLSGEWLESGTVYVADRELHGRRGYWVVTPVAVGASAMPVVRGWSPRAEAPAVDGEVTLTGWLQPSEGSNAPDDDPHDDVIPEMRIASLVEHVDTDLYSAFVVQREGSHAELAQVAPESIPDVSAFDGLRNLLYAIQWWVFGGFAVYVWVRWCRDQLEALERPLEDEPEEEPHPVAG